MRIRSSKDRDFSMAGLNFVVLTVWVPSIAPIAGFLRNGCDVMPAAGRKFCDVSVIFGKYACDARAGEGRKFCD